MNQEREQWIKVSVSALEADVAYFDARLALLSGKPSSYYQEAQIKAYKELGRVLSEMLQNLNAGSRIESEGGIEVEELTGGAD